MFRIVSGPLDHVLRTIGDLAADGWQVVSSVLPDRAMGGYSVVLAQLDD